MGKRFLCLYLIMLFTAGVGTVSAAVPAGAVTVEISPSTYQLAIGDSLTIFCTVTRSEDIKAGEPYPPSDNYLVDISKSLHTSEKTSPDTIQDNYAFLAYVFAPDTLQVGPFKVDYATPEGERVTAASNVLTFVISGFVTGAEPQSKPNRGPFGISAQGLPVWVLFVLILLVALIVGIVLYVIRKRKKAPPIIPEKPIDEIGEFERIRSLKLHESGRIGELYIFTSSALRGFIHRNMGFEALYDTSEEILYHLTQKNRDKEVTQAIRDIFEESDMVKFAKYIPKADRTSTVIDRALVPVRKVLDDIRREKERIAIQEKLEKVKGSEEG